MDNCTALYASYLHFTFGTNKMHASLRANEILVFFPAFLYRFMLFEFQVKDAVRTIVHVQIVQSSPGSVQV